MLNTSKGNCNKLKAFINANYLNANTCNTAKSVKIGNAVQVNKKRLSNRLTLNKIYNCNHVKIKLVNNCYRIACFDSSNNCIRLIFKDRKNISH